jgi:MYXO-CTERM domain-containing protein
MNGPNVGAATSIYLAGGAVTASPSTTAYTGTLGNVTVKQDLLGTNDHPSALVPSADGYIYALNPCAGTLDWSYDMGFPPGEVIFADTTGDGVDEMVVTAADGYLYAFSQELLAAPKWVYDTDPANGITNKEVSHVTTTNSLSAAWAPVAGADGYQIAVKTPGGSFVTEPNWIGLGNVTSTTTQPLPLVDGATYYQLVRAISKTKGASPTTSSSGVKVHVVSQTSSDAGTLKPGNPAGMDAGKGHGEDAAVDSGGAGASSSGCSCTIGPQEHRPATGLLAGPFALLLLFRRRR